MRKVITFISLTCLLLVGVLVNPAKALAQTDVLCGNQIIGKPLIINTAIGCIPVNDQNAFLGFILTWGIGIGGGIALILIAYSAFMIMSSTGNPERLKGGQELLTSALSGLILLIFSVFVLRLIGVQILQIPGFGN